MLVLAIDTSNRAMSVALVRDQTVLGETTINVRKTHSESLMPAVAQLFKSTSLLPAAVDRFVVAQGPGSYTGIRIAVTTAKTFAWTLHKELVGISSLAALAANVTTSAGLIIPVFNARRDAAFTGAYRWQNGELVSVLADRHTPMASWLAELATQTAPLQFIGDDVESFRPQITAKLGQQAQFVSGIDNLPHASKLALLGQTAQPVANIHRFAPNYLRITEAEANWLKQHPTNEGHEPYVEEI
ncbi:tRNA (adenosine(37)-N6)-threonylcarbamoyltransferase complex dimerization subunit type 1 TsaB [Loigolactobacillus backii]|uniref:tRNA threonylcarbamoyladenosine biosynthesis protein TsaB n=1 Tax=Loigolactobacillus backii TaxID=375175 RepID=A0A192H2J4_9LACO|nr:tRNA (adenosine(37)-N6)-threonylcarbamoyltransferase complex dimerization subunit type 1 TsaB [Loigolactobacillus backii]ANK59173.1 tRNA threonylcarbamoyladenosine biosynthesis protein TsaB [Loigolactobacillus backii]ANK62585.1 tRNA threonylcarbamoyladenosine biosynthesis protein TsaB [Loigolactobacillus backii]ANK64163.1 tRNA threonylcarbamoyladenosine biosynthesis protein TsaB [Loigolactobacillus backii]ANK67442.1 tRNA threonylcarbamoyladenosine biosynthesis protein TsaB [Loigolactobacillu